MPSLTSLHDLSYSHCPKAALSLQCLFQQKAEGPETMARALASPLEDTVSG